MASTQVVPGGGSFFRIEYPRWPVDMEGVAHILTIGKAKIEY